MLASTLTSGKVALIGRAFYRFVPVGERLLFDSGDKTHAVTVMPLTQGSSASTIKPSERFSDRHASNPLTGCFSRLFGVDTGPVRYQNIPATYHTD